MNWDYKKMFVRASVLCFFMTAGLYAICVHFGFKDFSVIKDNPGVLMFGMFAGLSAGYMQHVFVEKKDK